jgi:hypothetical protein
MANRDDLRPEYDLSQLKGGVRGKYHTFVQKTYALGQVAEPPGTKPSPSTTHSKTRNDFASSRCPSHKPHLSLPSTIP